ncbi:uncharacterized protein [Coffea arabica]|uniref:Uncharacterized protein isoform X2 n=1 Tax=Coffea arabica TaxID=13443 RepID=A0ABM4VHX4_COFAR
MICSCCEVTFLESCTRLLIYFLSFNLGTEVLQSLKSCKMGLRFWYVINITPVKLLLLNAEYIASKDFIQGWKVLYLVFTDNKIKGKGFSWRPTNREPKVLLSW